MQNDMYVYTIAQNKTTNPSKKKKVVVYTIDESMKPWVPTDEN